MDPAKHAARWPIPDQTSSDRAVPDSEPIDWKRLRWTAESSTVCTMNLAKLGTKGQVTIPKAVRDALAVEGETWWTVAATADGAIVLRPAFAT